MKKQLRKQKSIQKRMSISENKTKITHLCQKHSKSPRRNVWNWKENGLEVPLVEDEETC